MRSIITSAAIAALLAAPALADQTLEGVAGDTYELDQNHAFLTWTATHNGISSYTANFTDFDATLDFNPEEPTSSSIEVTINPASVETNYPGDFKGTHPDSSFDGWNEALARDARFFNTDEFPQITFVSTGAEKTGEYTGTVTGDLTFLGVTRPVTLDVTYNGTANLPWYGERDLIGFNASTTINRSDYGLDAVSGAVSDEVTIEFSGEFLQTE